MNYIVLFCNPQYCEYKGMSLTWHAHRLFDDRAEAEACAEWLKRCEVLTRVCRLKAVDMSRSRDKSGRFRKLGHDPRSPVFTPARDAAQIAGGGT